MTSQAQVRRLLSLVPYLREHDGASVADVAAAFGVSPRTLRADLVKTAQATVPEVGAVLIGDIARQDAR